MYSLVSNETDAVIRSYSREKIVRDKQLRKRLNVLLLQDMMTRMLIKIFYGQSIADVDLVQKLSYIQPVAGDNERVLRYGVRPPACHLF